MTPIYYITTQRELSDAQAVGHLMPPSLYEEGVVHCSFAHQVVAVENKYFHGRRDLLLLELDQTKLAAPVVEENLSGGADLYPHIYGILNLSAVHAICPFPSREDGTFEWPTELPKDEVS